MALGTGIATACSGYEEPWEEECEEEWEWEWGLCEEEEGGGEAKCPKPTVTTTSASAILSSSAKLNGSVNPQGCSTMYKFEWGPSSSPTTYPNKSIERSAGSWTIPGSVWEDISGLQPSTGYHFRLVATNSSGTTEGADVKFTTAPAATKYVALGDSYSAGTGTRSFYEPSCQQSVYAYPYRLRNLHPDWTFVNATCAGATTTDLIYTQATKLTSDTKWVTYTIGGNDAGFTSVIRACAHPFISESTCNSEIHKAKTFIQGPLGSRLDSANNTIKSRSPNAKVIVLDYPRLFNGQDCNTFTDFSHNEMTKLNELSEVIRGAISAAASRAGSNFIFKDAIPGFGGHAVCDGGEGSATEWINGHSSPESESYHPKSAGHANVYYPLVRGVTG